MEVATLTVVLVAAKTGNAIVVMAITTTIKMLKKRSTRFFDKFFLVMNKPPNEFVRNALAA